ncbi:MAG: hypothetical protein DLM72_10770 [Candidatus Nitrosopolaris wilkensis]|nr:MAG: hypothetical protein DLM72_10770 [Candidatus Nitrosopolaris wilkensis]
MHYGNQSGEQLRYSRGRSNGGGRTRGFNRASPARKPVEAGIIYSGNQQKRRTGLQVGMRLNV